MLDAHVRSALKKGRTFMRLSRRVWGLRKRTGRTYILPGPADMKKIDICVAIDTSGSMTDVMLRDICSEIKGIMQTFRDYRLRIWSFDDIAHPDTYAEFTPQNIDDFDNWRSKRVKGGGGTVFQSIYDFMRDRDIVPHRLIVFTDGFPNAGDWGEPHFCDTLFVIHAPTQVAQKIRAPYGVTAYYEPG
jgi:predicted metal-dependent peptidase